MCKKIARDMLTLLETCDLWPRARSKFHDRANHDDCDGIMRWYRYWVAKRPDVGRSIKRSGLKPIEDVREELEAVYARHPER